MREIDKLSAKYPKPEDAMKKQQEMMQLYNQYGGVAEMPFNHHLTLCHPLLLLTSIFPTYQGLFQ